MLYLAGYARFLLFNLWRTWFMPTAVLYEIMKASLWTEREVSLTSELALGRMLLSHTWDVTKDINNSVVLSLAEFVCSLPCCHPPLPPILSSSVNKPVISHSEWDVFLKSRARPLLLSWSKAGNRIVGNSGASSRSPHLITAWGSRRITCELQVVEPSSSGLRSYPLNLW